MKSLPLLCGAALLCAHITTAHAENSRPYLTAADAMTAIAACRQLAEEKNWNMSMVVIDRGMDIRASYRMDEALPASYKGATLKAETALSWSMPTGKVLEITQKMPVFNQFPGLLPIGGGLPIFSESGALIGGIGVAGGYIEHDEACAQAAVDALK